MRKRNPDGHMRAGERPQEGVPALEFARDAQIPTNVLHVVLSVWRLAAVILPLSLHTAMYIATLYSAAVTPPALGALVGGGGGGGRGLLVAVGPPVSGGCVCPGSGVLAALALGAPGNVLGGGWQWCE